jgi:hypothetical protein
MIGRKAIETPILMPTSKVMEAPDFWAKNHTLVEGWFQGHRVIHYRVTQSRKALCDLSLSACWNRKSELGSSYAACTPKLCGNRNRKRTAFPGAATARVSCFEAGNPVATCKMADSKNDVAQGASVNDKYHSIIIPWGAQAHALIHACKSLNTYLNYYSRKISFQVSMWLEHATYLNTA